MANFGALVLQVLGSLLWCSASVHAFESLQEVHTCRDDCGRKNHHKLCIKATNTKQSKTHHLDYCVNMEMPDNMFITGDMYVFEEKREKPMYWQFDKLEIRSSYKKSDLRVSFFEGDYCTFKPVSAGKEHPEGSFMPGPGLYTFKELQTVRCIHPHMWPGANKKSSTKHWNHKHEWVPVYDTTPQAGVGMKVTIWPSYEHGRPFPYSQIECETEEEAKAKKRKDPKHKRHYAKFLDVPQWADRCASGDDGIYSLIPDGKGSDDAFGERLDFAGSTKDAVVKKFRKKGQYPLGAIMINTFWNPHGDVGYSKLTKAFCTDKKYENYCVVTRVSDKKGGWDHFTGQVLSKRSEVCRHGGHMAYKDSHGWHGMHLKHPHMSDKRLPIWQVYTKLLSKSCEEIKAAHKFQILADLDVIDGKMGNQSESSDVIDGKMGNQSESSATHLRR